MKRKSNIYILFALLLSHCMCAVVAYNYSYLTTCNLYQLCSAPSSTAFLYAIPFVDGIVICISLFYNKNKKDIF